MGFLILYEIACAPGKPLSCDGRPGHSNDLLSKSNDLIARVDEHTGATGRVTRKETFEAADVGLAGRDDNRVPVHEAA